MVYWRWSGDQYRLCSSLRGCSVSWRLAQNLAMVWLSRDWYVLNFFKGDRISEDKAKYECLDGPTHAPTPDSFLSGAACDDNSLMVRIRCRCRCRWKFLQAKQQCWIYILKGDWVADDKAKYECLDGPTPAPTPDSCLSFCYNYRNLQRLGICQV